MTQSKDSVAFIGECLIELNGAPYAPLHQTYGGDSFNTALYLARLASDRIAVKYVTALGTDVLSEGMLRRWQAEGIDTHLVLRDAGRLPGLYWIQLDAQGERTFLYWRAQSAARYLLRHADFERVARELEQVKLIYLSGITLAILPPEDRKRLIAMLQGLAARGAAIVFDTNYRPALWASADEAREAASAILPAASLVFATFDDEQRLWGDVDERTTLSRLHQAIGASIVIKLGAAGCLYLEGGEAIPVPAMPVPTVVDTTAAGDGFNAGFLHGWLMGYPMNACCRAGNVLAGVIIRHPGAIIPREAMPSRVIPLLETL